MNYLAANLQVLKERLPALHASLVALSKEPAYPLVQDARGFVNVMLPTQDGSAKAFYAVEPRAEIERSLKLSPLNHPRLLIIDGAGLGYHVRDLLSAWPEPLSYVLLIEPDPKMFLAALTVTDLTRWLSDPRVHVFVGLAKDEFYPRLKDWLINGGEILTMTDRMGHFFFSPSMQVQGSYFADFATSLRAAITDLSNSFLAPPEDYYVGFMNLLGNAQRFEKTQLFSEIGQPFQDLPGVVVSSGPSLALHLDLLTQNQERVIIACVDSAVEMLLKRGIKPDIVFTLERVAENRRLFEPLPRDFKTPMVCLPSAFPSALEYYPGPLLLMPTATTFAGWIWPESSVLITGSCVSTQAMVGLKLLGCKEVALLGQDLAYDRQSKSSHVSEISDWIEEAEQYFVDQRGVGKNIPGNDGQPIPSNIYWETYVNDFAALIPRYDVNCLNVISASRGALVPHAKRVEPDSYWSGVAGYPALDKYALFSVHDKVTKGGQPVILQKARELLPQLEIFSKGCLNLLDQITSDYNENLSFTSGPERRVAIMQMFHGWRVKEDALLVGNMNLFTTFLEGFLRAPTIENRRARNSVWPITEIELMTFASYYVQITQFMLRDWLYWTRRLIHHIEGSLAK